ncbi:MAG: ABC transporter substrate-binding protein [Allosphingosinicella sp.]
MILIAWLTLAVLTGCRAKPHTTARDPVALQLSWSISPEHAAFLLGKDEIFPSYGIDLDLQPSRGSNETLASIAAGKYEFVIASAESLVLARSQGVKARSVLQLYRQSPAVVFSIRGIQLKSPRDLIGKRVGVIRTSTVATQFDLMLRLAGVPTSDRARPGVVQTVAATQGGSAQLESGQIDLLTQYTNYAAAQFLAKRRPVTELFFRDNGIDTYSAGIVVRDDTARNKRNLVQRFVCATIESLELARREPARALTAFAKWSSENTGTADIRYAAISLQRTNEMLSAGLNGHRMGYHDESGWRRTLATVREIEGEDLSNIKFSSLFDRSFITMAERPERCQALKR